MLKAKSSIIKKASATVIVIAIFFLGYFFGHQNLKLEQLYVPKLVNLELNKPSTVDFSIFWDAYNAVEKEYVTQPDSQKLMQGAISGMVDSLGDPFSNYMTKEESDSFMKSLNGEFEGIGAELAIKSKILTVMTILPETPADKAGLKPKDQIIAIDDKQTTQLSLAQAVDAIRGKSGTKVKLAILSPGAQQTHDLTITRQALKADSVTLTHRPDGLAVIRILQFGDDTSALMQKYAAELAKDKPKGLILDLRGNPGGLLTSSVDVVSLFTKDKTVVIAQDRAGNKNEMKTSGDPVLPDLPIAVLVDGGSASAAEIVSGALQDYGRAKIIGETTFGKGSVQDLINLNDGSTLRVTTAQWLTPNGRTISHAGIKPDIVIKADDTKDNDLQLDKAVSILLGGS